MPPASWDCPTQCPPALFVQLNISPHCEFAGLSAVNMSLEQLTLIRMLASLPQSDSSRDDPGGVDVEGEKVLRSDGHYWLNNPLQWPRLPRRQETRPPRK